MEDDGMWFAPKTFGYGSGLPVAWQGWALLGGYLAIVMAATVLLPRHVGLHIVVVIAATIAILPICAAKTRGGWRWRRGADD